jgi:CheY-like chemotaxis protein
MTAARGPLLLVEDDPDLSDVILEVLEAEGYAVVRTANGKDALDWLARGERPALLLLDFYMPRMNGWEFLEQFSARPESAGVPLVALTTTPVSHPSLVATLRKPFEMSALVALVRQVLDGP